MFVFSLHSKYYFFQLVPLNRPRGRNKGSKDGKKRTRKKRSFNEEQARRNAILGKRIRSAAAQPGQQTISFGGASATQTGQQTNLNAQVNLVHNQTSAAHQHNANSFADNMQNSANSHNAQRRNVDMTIGEVTVDWNEENGEERLVGNSDNSPNTGLEQYFVEVQK